MNKITNVNLRLNSWERKKGIISQEEWKANRQKILRLARVKKIMGWKK